MNEKNAIENGTARDTTRRKPISSLNMFDLNVCYSWLYSKKKNEVKWKKKKKSRQNTTGQMDLRTHRFKRIADLTDYLPFKNEKSVNNTMRFCFRSFLFIYCTRCQTKAIRNILYFAMAVFARVMLLLLLLLFSCLFILQFCLIACHQKWSTKERQSFLKLKHYQPNFNRRFVHFWMKFYSLLNMHIFTIYEIANQMVWSGHAHAI